MASPRPRKRAKRRPTRARDYFRDQSLGAAYDAREHAGGYPETGVPVALLVATVREKFRATRKMAPSAVVARAHALGTALASAGDKVAFWDPGARGKSKTARDGALSDLAEGIALLARVGEGVKLWGLWFAASRGELTLRILVNRETQDTR